MFLYIQKVYCTLVRCFVCVQGNLDALGEVLLQDNFMAWDPKQLIKKGRERHLFMFEVGLLVAKEVKDNAGKSKYMYKMKFMVGELVYCGVLYHLLAVSFLYTVFSF